MRKCEYDVDACGPVDNGLECSLAGCSGPYALLRPHTNQYYLHKHLFWLQADEPAAFGDSLLQASQTSTGAPCWAKVDADGTQTTIASADPSALFNFSVRLCMIEVPAHATNASCIRFAWFRKHNDVLV